jgi:hypothetical protein
MELVHYRVILHGGFVALTSRRFWLWRRRESVGFYTTRLVRAVNRASAEAQAIALVRAELAESQLEAFDRRPLAIDVERVDELESFGDSSAPGGGFTFYPEGS